MNNNVPITNEDNVQSTTGQDFEVDINNFKLL
jgi:hypothetical protein